MSKTTDRMMHLLLYFGFLIGFVAVYTSRYDSLRQFGAVMTLVVFYLLWGYVYHHHFKKDVSRKIILEYLFIALIALGASVLVFVL